MTIIKNYLFKFIFSGVLLLDFRTGRLFASTSQTSQTVSLSANSAVSSGRRGTQSAGHSRAPQPNMALTKRLAPLTGVERSLEMCFRLISHFFTFCCQTGDPLSRSPKRTLYLMFNCSICLSCCLSPMFESNAFTCEFYLGAIGAMGELLAK